MKKIFVITILVILFTFLLGKFLDYRYKKFWRPVFNKLDVTFKDTTYYDGIYVGNSRVHFGINPYYTDSITGLNSYNEGMIGASINEIYFLTAAYLSHHKTPKYAAIAIGYADILQSYRPFENPCYYLYYLDDTMDNRILEQQHYHTALFKMMPILKYTAFDDFNKLTIWKNLNGEAMLKPGGIEYRGYMNNSKNVFQTVNQERAMKEDTSFQKGIYKCEELIKLLKKNNCLPILIYAPVLDIDQVRKNKVFIKIDSAISKLSSTYDAPILHYDTGNDFSKEMFGDQWHLNIDGSILFSKKLGADIRNILAQKN